MTNKVEANQRIISYVIIVCALCILLFTGIAISLGVGKVLTPVLICFFILPALLLLLTIIFMVQDAHRNKLKKSEPVLQKAEEVAPVAPLLEEENPAVLASNEEVLPSEVDTQTQPQEESQPQSEPEFMPEVVLEPTPQSEPAEENLTQIVEYHAHEVVVIEEKVEVQVASQQAVVESSASPEVEEEILPPVLSPKEDNEVEGYSQITMLDLAPKAMKKAKKSNPKKSKKATTKPSFITYTDEYNQVSQKVMNFETLGESQVTERPQAQIKPKKEKSIIKKDSEQTTRKPRKKKPLSDITLQTLTPLVEPDTPKNDTPQVVEIVVDTPKTVDQEIKTTSTVKTTITRTKTKHEQKKEEKKEKSSLALVDNSVVEERVKKLTKDLDNKKIKATSISEEAPKTKERKVLTHKKSKVLIKSDDYVFEAAPKEDTNRHFRDKLLPRFGDNLSSYSNMAKSTQSDSSVNVRSELLNKMRRQNNNILEKK